MKSTPRKDRPYRSSASDGPCRRASAGYGPCMSSQRQAQVQTPPLAQEKAKGEEAAGAKGWQAGLGVLVRPPESFFDDCKDVEGEIDDLVSEAKKKCKGEEHLVVQQLKRRVTQMIASGEDSALVINMFEGLVPEHIYMLLLHELSKEEE